MMQMKRIRDQGEAETRKNVSDAWQNYSKGKSRRKDIKDYEENLEERIDHVLQLLKTEEWKPEGYIRKVIFNKKKRVLGKASVLDNHIEAAAILPYEKALYDYTTYRAPAVKPGLGTMGFYKLLRNELYKNSVEEMRYFLPMDVHHYFPSMSNDILEEKISRKVKQGKLRRVMYKVIESYLQGVPLGVKISQIFGQIYLADFDRLAMRGFDILNNTEKTAYWTARYIEHCIVTARTKEEERELAKGSIYLAEKFRQFLRQGVLHYYRFVDNIIFIHRDKAFLHIIKEISIMVMARDYRLEVNKDYNIRPTYTGIRICGYIFYHEKVMLSKHNKHELCRRIMSLHKKGFSEEQIRIKLSSNIGFAKHADVINLLRVLGMEKSLGKIIKKKRQYVPFEGLDADNKIKFSEICSPLKNIGGGNFQYKILLTDYIIRPSIIKKVVTYSQMETSNGVRKIPEEKPAEVMAIRFKKILRTEIDLFGNEEYICEKVKDTEGKDTKEDAEYYAYTGSEVLIDQAKNDFSREDLPCPTVIQEFETKQGKKFFKFT